jgi:hypothetical protein
MKTLANTIRKAFIAIAVMGLFALTSSTQAQLVNPGFETGDGTGWSNIGYFEASTGETYNAWVVNPANSFMGYIYPVSSIDRTGAETALNLTAGSLLAYNNGLFSGTTDFSVLYQDVALAANQSVTIWWNFVSTDYAPFNDGCIATFTGPSTQEIHILAVTSNAYGDTEAIIVGDYGSSGWYSLTFTASTAGTYRVGYANFNIADQILDPWNFLDNAPGGTSAPGEPIVLTDAITNIAPPTATGGGSVATGQNTPAITARGICWNTTGSPTIADDFTVDGSGFGSFTSTLTGLAGGTTYFVRAYATNTSGTYYGPQVSFTTEDVPPVPVSNWALILGAVAIVIFTLIRFRRLS